MKQPTYPRLTRDCQIYWRGHEITLNGDTPDSHFHPGDTDLGLWLCIPDLYYLGSDTFISAPTAFEILYSYGISMAMIANAIQTGTGIDLDNVPPQVPACKPCYQRSRPRWSFEPFEWRQVPDALKAEF
jgi:hypothetical protein